MDLSCIAALVQAAAVGGLMLYMGYIFMSKHDINFTVLLTFVKRKQNRKFLQDLKPTQHVSCSVFNNSVET